MVFSTKMELSSAAPSAHLYIYNVYMLKIKDHISVVCCKKWKNDEQVKNAFLLSGKALYIFFLFSIFLWPLLLVGTEG